MFVPLHDSTPLKVIRFQAVTITIIALNVVMYLSTGAFNSEAVLQTIATGWGVVPGELTHSTSVAVPYHPVPEPFTLISYMFLHAGWWHLISNMLFLWVFADNIEDAYGHAAFAFLYLMSGVVAALLYVLMAPASDIPLVGASGAVSGILGAYVVLFPHARVWILLFLRIPLRIGAAWVLGGWFLLHGQREPGGRRGLGRPCRWVHCRGGADLCAAPSAVDAAGAMKSVLLPNG
jgi:membrane associated rhomboid family serine protease